MWPIEHEAKNLKNDCNPVIWVLGESYPMNTNMTGFKWFSKRVLVLWRRVASSIGRVKHEPFTWTGLDAKGEPMAPGQ